MEYSIGQIAEKLNINASTLRFYDKEGLLPSVNRSAGGIRVFRDADLNWLKLLECLKATGMPIKDIRQFCDWMQQGDDTIGQRQQMMHERRDAVQKQIAELQRTLAIVNFKCWYYDTAAEQGTEANLKKMKSEDLPKEIRALKKKGGLI